MGFVNPRNVGNARDMRKGPEKKKECSCNLIVFALYNALWWILALHYIGNFKCSILYLWNGLGIYVTLCFCFAKAKWNIISTSSTNIVKYGLLVYPNVENIIHVQQVEDNWAAGIFTIIYRNYLRFFLWLVFNVISFWNFKYLNLVWKGYTWCAPSRRHYGIRCFWRRSLRCCWQQHYTISRYWRGKRNS